MISRLICLFKGHKFSRWGKFMDGSGRDFRYCFRCGQYEGDIPWVIVRKARTKTLPQDKKKINVITETTKKSKNEKDE